MSSPRVVAIIQARMGSSRFPGKVLKKLRGVSLLETMISRVKMCQSIDEIVIAIPEGAADDQLAHTIADLGVQMFRGSSLDVQSRFIEAALTHQADLVVRLTADCPLSDWSLIDEVVTLAIDTSSDYCSNLNPPTFPDGLDVEVFKLSSLIESRSENPSKNAFEHVTTDLRSTSRVGTANLLHHSDLSDRRWTVDYPDDLIDLEEKLPREFLLLSWKDILHSGFVGIPNGARVRNEGLLMNEGQKLWSRAKRVIPGGSMLLSKRPEMFLPDHWPAYYSRSKGISVWDLEGREFKDFANMSVGACSLGYGNEKVDEAVSKAVRDGVMSTLNSPQEVVLAERLIELHPWSEMARFARSGGEANAIAVRIARAHTGRDKVAICGYHGWHDWYLSANLSEDSNLDGHLLPGLQPTGVPRSLLGSTVPFSYNDAETLEDLLATGEFAAVQMEVSRNFGPEPGFLEKVREICFKYGSVLIFDECTSGFRETFGGLHKKYAVEPDMAMFGKAMGNGFAITAVLGSRRIMESAQSTFISSTFWTERLGPVAALATLDEMERQNSWTVISKAGSLVKDAWRRTFDTLGIGATIGGLDALGTFALDVPHWPVLRTLFIQEMLDRGFLATSGFYASTMHNEVEIANYEQAFLGAMKVVSDNFEESSAISRLRGPVAHSGFKRLN